MPNKGKGAGGAKTNENGLLFESNTCLATEYSVVKEEKYGKIIIFNKNSDKIFMEASQRRFFKHMKEKEKKDCTKAHGCKNPDECYINEKEKLIFIIEKKFQEVSGSACEKIQTAHFKRRQYSKHFPEYKIIYIYCLSNWFNKNMKPTLEYLKEENIPVFWGENLTYKQEIIDFIINYK